MGVIVIDIFCIYSLTSHLFQILKQSDNYLLNYCISKIVNCGRWSNKWRVLNFNSNVPRGNSMHIYKFEIGRVNIFQVTKCYFCSGLSAEAASEIYHWAPQVYKKYICWNTKNHLNNTHITKYHHNNTHITKHHHNMIHTSLNTIIIIQISLNTITRRYTYH